MKRLFLFLTMLSFLFGCKKEENEPDIMGDFEGNYKVYQLVVGGSTVGLDLANPPSISVVRTGNKTGTMTMNGKAGGYDFGSLQGFTFNIVPVDNYYTISGVAGLQGSFNFNLTKRQLQLKMNDSKGSRVDLLANVL